jgi:2'-hydroxyisoflavone reductase
MGSKPREALSTLDRRAFVRAGSAALGALAVGATPSAGSLRTGPSTDRSRSDDGGRALDILILGGTSFLGPPQVHLALERGHAVTIFTRGRTQPRMYRDDFAHVEHLIGDRENDLTALEGRRWDVVIDNSTRRAAWAESSVALLRDAAEQYVFISSTGVYYPYLTPGVDEDGPVPMVDTRGGDDVSMAYGVMKANGEAAARAGFGDRAIVLRPGHIVGPGDTQPNRFPYWTTRMERGGEVLVPGKPSDPVQLVDVRDLIAFMFRLFESGTGGTYNVVGPASPMTLEEFVHGARACTDEPVSWVWADDYEWLAERGLREFVPWVLPVGDEANYMRIDGGRAHATGLLTHRPLARTILDVMDWWHSDAMPADVRAKVRFPLTPERERELIAEWRARA